MGGRIADHVPIEDHAVLDGGRHCCIRCDLACMPPVAIARLDRVPLVGSVSDPANHAFHNQGGVSECFATFRSWRMRAAPTMITIAAPVMAAMRRTTAVGALPWNPTKFTVDR
jgi:hypothetical protein